MAEAPTTKQELQPDTTTDTQLDNVAIRELQSDNDYQVQNPDGTPFDADLREAAKINKHADEVEAERKEISEGTVSTATPVQPLSRAEVAKRNEELQPTVPRWRRMLKGARELPAKLAVAPVMPIKAYLEKKAGEFAQTTVTIKNEDGTSEEVVAGRYKTEEMKEGNWAQRLRAFTGMYLAKDFEWNEAINDEQRKNVREANRMKLADLPGMVASGAKSGLQTGAYMALALTGGGMLTVSGEVVAAGMRMQAAALMNRIITPAVAVATSIKQVVTKNMYDLETSRFRIAVEELGKLVIGVGFGGLTALTGVQMAEELSKRFQIGEMATRAATGFGGFLLSQYLVQKFLIERKGELTPEQISGLRMQMAGFYAFGVLANMHPQVSQNMENQVVQESIPQSVPEAEDVSEVIAQEEARTVLGGKVDPENFQGKSLFTDLDSAEESNISENPTLTKPDKLGEEAVPISQETITGQDSPEKQSEVFSKQVDTPLSQVETPDPVTPEQISVTYETVPTQVQQQGVSIDFNQESLPDGWVDRGLTGAGGIGEREAVVQVMSDLGNANPAQIELVAEIVGKSAEDLTRQDIVNIATVLGNAQFHGEDLGVRTLNSSDIDDLARRYGPGAGRGVFDAEGNSLYSTLNSTVEVDTDGVVEGLVNSQVPTRITISDVNYELVPLNNQDILDRIATYESVGLNTGRIIEVNSGGLYLFQDENGDIFSIRILDSKDLSIRDGLIYLGDAVQTLLDQGEGSVAVVEDAEPTGNGGATGQPSSQGAGDPTPENPSTQLPEEFTSILGEDVGQYEFVERMEATYADFTEDGYIDTVQALNTEEEITIFHQSIRDAFELEYNQPATPEQVLLGLDVVQNGGFLNNDELSMDITLDRFMNSEVYEFIPEGSIKENLGLFIIPAGNDGSVSLTAVISLIDGLLEEENTQLANFLAEEGLTEEELRFLFLNSEDVRNAAIVGGLGLAVLVVIGGFSTFTKRGKVIRQYRRVQNLNRRKGVMNEDEIKALNRLVQVLNQNPLNRQQRMVLEELEERYRPNTFEQLRGAIRRNRNNNTGQRQLNQANQTLDELNDLRIDNKDKLPYQQNLQRIISMLRSRGELQDQESRVLSDITTAVQQQYATQQTPEVREQLENLIRDEQNWELFARNNQDNANFVRRLLGSNNNEEGNSRVPLTYEELRRARSVIRGFRSFTRELETGREAVESGLGEVFDELSSPSDEDPIVAMRGYLEDKLKNDSGFFLPFDEDGDLPDEDGMFVNGLRRKLRDEEGELSDVEVLILSELDDLSEENRIDLNKDSSALIESFKTFETDSIADETLAEFEGFTRDILQEAIRAIKLKISKENLLNSGELSLIQKLKDSDTTINQVEDDNDLGEDGRLVEHTNQDSISIGDTAESTPDVQVNNFRSKKKVLINSVERELFSNVQQSRQGIPLLEAVNPRTDAEQYDEGLNQRGDNPIQ